MKITFMLEGDAIRTETPLDVDSFLDNLVTIEDDAADRNISYTIHYFNGAFTTPDFEVLKDYLQFTLNLFDFKYEATQLTIYFEQNEVIMGEYNDINDNDLII